MLITSPFIGGLFTSALKGNRYSPLQVSEQFYRTRTTTSQKAILGDVRSQEWGMPQGIYLYKTAGGIGLSRRKPECWSHAIARLDG
jgi:hypothetical protein